MLVPLLLAAAVQAPHVQAAPPVFAGFRTELFTPLDRHIARMLGEEPARVLREFPLLRVRGVTVTLPADFRVL